MIRKKTVKAIFKYPEGVDSLITDARAFYKAISTAPGNTFVVIDPAEMLLAEERIDTLSNDQVATKAHTKGSADTRDVSEMAVVNDIREFVRVVQKAADNAPDEEAAKTVVTNCGLVTQEPTIRNKEDWEVRNHETIDGLLDFISKAAKKDWRAAYEVEQSMDNIIYTSAKVSIESRTTFIHNKPPGTKMYYRRRIILGKKNGGIQEWSQPFWLYVF